MFSHLQDTRAASCLTVTWGNKHHHPERPPLPSSSPALHAEHGVIRCGRSLGSAGVSCPGCAPSPLLVHSQLTHWWGGVRTRKDPDFLVTTKLSSYYQRCSHTKSKAQQYTSYYEEN